jgi:hypothetical protein
MGFRLSLSVCLSVYVVRAQKEEDWKHILKDSNAEVLFVANRAIYDKICAMREGLGALRDIVVLDGFENHNFDDFGLIRYDSGNIYMHL